MARAAELLRRLVHESDRGTGGQIIAALDDADVEFALCGGLAMAAHGFIRATEDIDLIIGDSDLDAAMKAVASCGFTIPGGEITLKPGTAQAGRIFRV